MNRDIRLSVGFWQHPKTCRLMRDVGLEGVRSLQILWCWVAQNRSDGDISDLDCDDIEAAADWRGGQGEFYMAIKDRWLEQCDEKLFLHDWLDHNPWVADAEERSGKAYLSKLSQVNRKVYELLVSKGISTLTKDEYFDYKNQTCETLANAERTQSEPQRVASESVSETLAPSPTPSPSPKEKKNNLLVPKSADADSRLVCRIPVRGSPPVDISQEQIDDWQAVYSAVDVSKTIHEIRLWNETNPTKQKTKVGVWKHITGWLARAQNNGGGNFKMMAESHKLDWAERKELELAAKGTERVH